ncbi:GNAT family N-acetyltransferase [Breoghania sp. L-A4]|uniref:GNAT family N-acetyltransferase n=1 Tax=Breoghania sp. L-A4 TaxID=2304600 RepID=UPI0013C2FD25|nr:GNAT family N-acetyltransferase [Breoghania sp. L-A4]
MAKTRPMAPTAVSARASIRHARPADVPAIRAMQQKSMWVLGGAFYSDDEIAGFLTQYRTMDDAIVAEGHFFVTENQAGRILGSGGWTRRRPGYTRGLGGSTATAALPTVRSVFVDPAAARRGIATSIMARTERDAVEHGIPEFTLTATLSGAALYERLGYLGQGSERLALNRGGGFACIRMTKRIDGGCVPAVRMAV